jgi:hypothetical protein
MLPRDLQRDLGVAPGGGAQGGDGGRWDALGVRIGEGRLQPDGQECGVELEILAAGDGSWPTSASTRAPYHLIVRAMVSRGKAVTCTAAGSRL